jgi:hypothetical protein
LNADAVRFRRGLFSALDGMRIAALEILMARAGIMG